MEEELSDSEKMEDLALEVDRLRSTHELEESDNYQEDEDWLFYAAHYSPCLFATFPFAARCSQTSVDVKEETFKTNLLKFIKQFRKKEISLDSVLVDRLYQQAVLAHKHLNDWDEAKEMVGGEEFKRSVAYIEQEIDRYAKIRKQLSESGKEKPPSWTSEWCEYWVHSLLELSEGILCRLSIIQRYLEEVSHVTRLGRLFIETHLLVNAEGVILESLPESGYQTINVILAAYAYASRLVPRPKYDEVKAITKRMSRARKSKEAGYIRQWIHDHEVNR